MSQDPTTPDFPQSLQMFVRQVEAQIEEDSSINAKAGPSLVTTIENLLSEVHDLRGTGRAMEDVFEGVTIMKRIPRR